MNNNVILFCTYLLVLDISIPALNTLGHTLSTFLISKEKKSTNNQQRLF